MVSTFDILSASTNIHQSRLLEASAGTGKTFSIENLIVRFLIEGNNPCTINELLVVTFTRKAAAELRDRIRSAIVSAIKAFDHGDGNDYLMEYIKRGEEAVRCAKKRLADALFAYDEKQVFTIHGFCSRMMREHAFESDNGFVCIENNMTAQEIAGVVKDFFRIGVKGDLYSTKQLDILMKYYKDSMSVAEKVASLVTKQGEFEPLPSLNECRQIFLKRREILMSEYPYSSEEIIALFHGEAHYYCKICDKKGVVKDDISAAVALFADVMEQLLPLDLLIGGGFDFLDLFIHENRKKKFTMLQKSASLFERARELFADVRFYAEDPKAILSRMVSDCRRIVYASIDKHEKSSPDILLEQMSKALEKEPFANAIRSRYRVAIIDEFQDTDPLQWHIFSTLFLEKHNSENIIYLVGDPKQSIYAFRNADIYTYLRASDALGPRNISTLSTNYRSHSDLVNAFNILFKGENTPSMITLPRDGREIIYHEVLSSRSVERMPLSKEKGSVHFFIAEGRRGRSHTWPTAEIEEHSFFPFIANEIISLNGEGISYGSCTVLVRDRYQARRIDIFLRQYGIPTAMRSTKSLVESDAWIMLKEMLCAVIAPRDRSAVKAALSGRLIAWDDAMVRLFSDGIGNEKAFALFYSLKKTLYGNGFAAFFAMMMKSVWHDDMMSIAESLIARDGGADVYNELMQIADVVIEYQNTTHATPHALIRYLDDTDAIADDDTLRVRSDVDPDAVTIMTLHISKGLEFDVVFALGLASRTRNNDDFMYVNEGIDRKIIVAREGSNAWERYCEEADAEKMRQLYVAMTRAKQRVYVPVAIEGGELPISYGTASPMELFLARLDQETATYTTLYERIRTYKKEALQRFIDNHDELGYTLIDSAPNVKQVYRDDKQSVLFSPRDVVIAEKPLFFHSFTSLALDSSDGSLLNPPHDHENEIKTPHTLPAGSVTGMALHSLMERLMTEGISTADGIASIASGITAKSPLKGWEGVLSDIAHTTITAPLSLGDSEFRLCDIDRSSVLCEMPFLFAEYEKNYLTGSVDLIFFHNKKYYIIDWKSTWLGEGIHSYTHEALHAAMTRHDYHLQGGIYTQALKRYLSITEARLFDECFGGVVYCFLRGMDASEGEGTGVYHFFPDETMLRRRL